MIQSELRMATEMTAVNGTLRDIRDLLRDRLDLRDRVARVESDVAELKQRL